MEEEMKVRTAPEEETGEKTQEEIPLFSFSVRLDAKELWKFSMYHSNRGFLGIFNLLFTVAAIYLLITQWASVSAAYRLLLVVCALMFTVWQPASLYLKAMRQAKSPMVKDPMILSFGESGLTIEQRGEKAQVPWEGLSLVAESKSQFIIYRDRIHAFLLPKSVVGGKEQEEKLKELVREKMPLGSGRGRK